MSECERLGCDSCVHVLECRPSSEFLSPSVAGSPQGCLNMDQIREVACSEADIYHRAGVVCGVSVY